MVVLCDSQGKALGEMEKMQAHREAHLHKAFSILIFNSQGQILLQKRAQTKYHSGGLWTNTCCGHPRPNEDPAVAALRRLYEEMGMMCTLKKVLTFEYKAQLDPQMTEHEIDEVFVGVSDELPFPDPNEAEDFRYQSPEEIFKELEFAAQRYTVWFKILMTKLKEDNFFE
jgi:isopentenyl-diphosphate delta-isomerase